MTIAWVELENTSSLSKRKKPVKEDHMLCDLWIQNAQRRQIYRHSILWLMKHYPNVTWKRKISWVPGVGTRVWVKTESDCSALWACFMQW